MLVYELDGAGPARPASPKSLACTDDHLGKLSPTRRKRPHPFIN